MENNQENTNRCPSMDIAETCKNGIELSRKYNRGSSIVGIKLAQSIISAAENKRELPISVITQIYNFFNRHKKNKNTKKDKEPGNGKIAWTMWGGDKCYSWVKKIIKKTKAQNMTKSFLKLANALDIITNNINKEATPFDLVVALNYLLADEFVLYTKLRNYHWNVLGVHFNDLHKFFETQYVIIEDIVDTIAERIRALGAKSPGTLSEFSRLSQIKEDPSEILSDTRMITNLLDDYKTIILFIRIIILKSDKSEPVTANLLSDICFKHEKTKWMLQSLLTQI